MFLFRGINNLKIKPKTYIEIKSNPIPYKKQLYFQEIIVRRENKSFSVFEISNTNDCFFLQNVRPELFISFIQFIMKKKYFKVFGNDIFIGRQRVFVFMENKLWNKENKKIQKDMIKNNKKEIYSM